MRLLLMTILVLMMCAPAGAQQNPPASIAVFPIELEDRSAGAGIIAPDEHDKRYLSESEQMAKDMLTGSGRYTVVGVTVPAEAEAKGLRYCGGCEAAIARQNGASLALLGVVTRVNRTEHAVFIRILDAKSGKTVAEGFTDLRMGANYAWPRSVKWVMTNKILR